MHFKKAVKIGLCSLALMHGVSFAGGGIKIGSLSCHVDGSVGFIFGSTKKIDCYFTREKGKREHYTGQIKNFGVDIGFTNDGFLVWAVIAATTNVRPGGLQGDFVGVGADVGIGLGLGANALVLQVGDNQAIGLQPLSIKGFEGLNVAGGIRGLHLKHRP